jgi:hypothetical protein
VTPRAKTPPDWRTIVERTQVKVPYTREGEDGLMNLPVSGSTEENFANILICGMRTSEIGFMD